MVPTLGKPARKRRRRWLIVAFVLVLVSMGTWWYWPRGDARFVGKWNVYDDFQDPTKNFPGPVQTITFYSNGTVRIQVLRGKNPPTMFAAWCVKGNQLQVGYQVPARFRSTAVSAARSLAKMTRRYLIFFEWGNDFSFAGPDEFRVHARTGNDGHVYRRIPE